MDGVKYIGMDVHKETISIAVRNSSGKLVMECVIETKASTILQFFQGLSGSLQVTFEEGTWAAWLYDLLKPHVTELVYQQLDALRLLRQQARKELLAEARKHRATKLLSQIPGIGSLRAAHLVALIQTPHRFRTKRQLWTYSGAEPRLYPLRNTA